MGMGFSLSLVKLMGRIMHRYENPGRAFVQNIVGSPGPPPTSLRKYRDPERGEEDGGFAEHFLPGAQLPFSDPPAQWGGARGPHCPESTKEPSVGLLGELVRCALQLGSAELRPPRLPHNIPVLPGPCLMERAKGHSSRSC